MTKRAVCEENATMEWIDGNIGSKLTMKYPAVILKGEGARGMTLSIGPFPARAIESVMPRAPSPFRITAGYFIVSLEPMFPSIHSIVAFSSQTGANNVFNLVTKRAVCEENATMEWIDGNIGSKLTMKYPAVILKGEGARGMTSCRARLRLSG